MNEREKRKHLQERQLIYFSGLLEVINMRNGDEKNFYNLVFCLKIINMKRGEKKTLNHKRGKISDTNVI